MDERVPLFSVECDEPEGTIVRHVRLALLSMEKLAFWYGKLSQFKDVFNDQIKTPEDFIKVFITQDEHGEVTPTGLIWEIDDVGIVYITDIRPEYECLGHFSFWDGRLRGREKLLLEMLKYVMEMFKFHRIVTEVPMYKLNLLGPIERLGFVKEGRKREAVMRDGEWYDVNQYSILDHEVLG